MARPNPHHPGWNPYQPYGPPPVHPYPPQVHPYPPQQRVIIPQQQQPARANWSQKKAQDIDTLRQVQIFHFLSSIHPS